MLISTIVNKDYQRYVPWFVLFATESYPEYGVKIYLTEKIDHIEAFKLVETPNVVYMENSFKQYPKSNQELKTLLFLSAENENTYQAGDVDVLICRERPTLEQYHLDLCRVNKLPYNSYYRLGTKRMITGAHFVTTEYFDIMKPVIMRYRKLHKSRNLNLGKRRDGRLGNEDILYKMLREAGLEVLPQTFSTLHGFHLGIWRNQGVAYPRFIHTAPLYHLHWYEFFLKIEQTEKYQMLKKILPLHEIERMKANMEDYIKTL